MLAEHLGRLLPDGGRILDIGCGDGSLARLVMDRRPDVEVVGIDVLVRPDTHIPVEAFDGTTIPYDDASFDGAVIVDVLHHTEDPIVLLREAARVAPRTVVVKDHLADGFLARPTLKLMDWVGNAHHGVGLPFNYWTTGRWRQAIGELGLTTETWETDVGLYPWPASMAFDRHLHLLCRLSASV